MTQPLTGIKVTLTFKDIHLKSKEKFQFKAPAVIEYNLLVTLVMIFFNIFKKIPSWLAYGVIEKQINKDKSLHIGELSASG